MLKPSHKIYILVQNKCKIPHFILFDFKIVLVKGGQRVRGGSGGGGGGGGLLHFKNPKIG